VRRKREPLVMTLRTLLKGEMLRNISMGMADKKDAK